MGIFAAIVNLLITIMVCGTAVLVSKMWMEHQQSLEQKRQETLRARDIQRQINTAPYYEAMAEIARARASRELTSHDVR